MATQPGRLSGRLHWPGLLVLGATTAVTAVFGWFAIWTSRLSTDEGYLLSSLREWVDRGDLYGEVFTQYGPAYYLVFGLPARLLGFAWTITAGRLTNLVLWVVITFLLGLVAWKLTGRIVFGVVAQFATFSLLAVLTLEPMHPGALLCLLLAVLMVNIAVLRPQHPVASDLITGGLLAVVILTKINVGGFAVVGVAFAAASTFRFRYAGALRVLVDIALVAVGPVLLLSNGADEERVTFAALYVAAAAYVVIASRIADRRCEPGPSFRLVTAGIGLAAVGLLIGLVVVATGTSVASLADGILIRPTRQPDFLNIPIPLPWFAWLWIAGVPVVLLLLRDRTFWPATVRAGTISGMVRVAGGVVLAASVYGPLSGSPYNVEGARFLFVPLVALVVLPTLVADQPVDGGMFARRALGALALTQTLHAYPVPGSQVAWGLFLALVCGVVVVADGVTELIAANAFDLGAWPGVVAGVGAALVIAIPLIAPLGVSHPQYPSRQLVHWWRTYEREPRLGLDGTGPLRLGGFEAAGTRAIATSLTTNCDTFVAFPALLVNFYMLSGVPPPSGFNPTIHDLLTRDEKREVVRGLRRTPGRVCLVLAPFTAAVTPDPGGSLRVDVVREHGPLVQYLEGSRWELVTDHEGYQILRRQE